MNLWFRVLIVLVCYPYKATIRRSKVKNKGPFCWY